MHAVPATKLKLLTPPVCESARRFQIATDRLNFYISRWPLDWWLNTPRSQIPDPRHLCGIELTDISGIFLVYLSGARSTIALYRGLTVWPVKMEYRLTFSIHIILIWSFNFLNRLLILQWKQNCLRKKLLLHEKIMFQIFLSFNQEFLRSQNENLTCSVLQKAPIIFWKFGKSSEKTFFSHLVKLFWTRSNVRTGTKTQNQAKKK